MPPTLSPRQLKNLARLNSVIDYHSQPEVVVETARRLCASAILRDEKRCKSERKSHFKKRYGLTIEQYDQMAYNQGFACAICRKHRKLHVDHNHVTGKVRGLLCHNCNAAIGLFHEAISHLQRAMEYLSNDAS